MTPQLWSVNALSVELAIDRRSLSRRLEGLKPAQETQHGRRLERLYRMRDVFQHLAAGGEQGIDLQLERGRMARLQREELELEIALKRGEVAHIETIVEHWQSMVVTFRHQVLAIPARAAPMLARKEEAEIWQVLKDLLHQALIALAGKPIPSELADRIAAHESSRQALSERRSNGELPRSRPA